jgi:hypothetical protein
LKGRGGKEKKEKGRKKMNGRCRGGESKRFASSGLAYYLHLVSKRPVRHEIDGEGAKKEEVRKTDLAEL